MGGLQLGIEIVLIGLLGGTLLHGLRLQRLMGSMKHDRAELEQLIERFNDSNQQAESGAERLRIASETATRAMTRQIDGASNLREELAELIERGERLSGRLGHAKGEGGSPRHLPPPDAEFADMAPRVRSQAEQDLLRALRVSR